MASAMKTREIANRDIMNMMDFWRSDQTRGSELRESFIESIAENAIVEAGVIPMRQLRDFIHKRGAHAMKGSGKSIQLALLEISKGKMHEDPSYAPEEESDSSQEAEGNEVAPDESSKESEAEKAVTEAQLAAPQGNAADAADQASKKQPNEAAPRKLCQKDDYHPRGSKDPGKNDASQLLKQYSHESSKCSGDSNQDLGIFCSELKSNCRILGASGKESVEAMHIAFSGEAKKLCHQKIKGKLGSNIDAAFREMRSEFFGRNRQLHALAEWRKTAFASAKQEDEKRSEALKRLHRHLSAIQTQLETACQSDPSLRDKILQACQAESFSRDLKNVDPIAAQEALNALSEAIVNYGSKNPGDRSKAKLAPVAQSELDDAKKKSGCQMSCAKFKKRAKRCQKRSLRKSQSRESQQKHSPKDEKGNCLRCHICDSTMHLSPQRQHRASKMLLAEAEGSSSDPASSSSDESVSEAESFHASLASSSGAHAIFHTNAGAACQSKKRGILSHRASPHFPPNVKPSPALDGACLDDGSPMPAIGLPQFLARFRIAANPKEVTIGAPSISAFRFGESACPSIGAAMMRAPVKDHSFFEHSADIASCDAPALFGLEMLLERDLRACPRGCKLHNDVWELDLRLRKQHLHIVAPCSSAMRSQAELQSLRKQFGHPDSSKLCKLLKRAGEEVEHKGLLALKDIERSCEPCQRASRKPRRCAAAMPSEISFSYEAGLDIMHVESSPRFILHASAPGSMQQLSFHPLAPRASGALSTSCG